MPISGPRSVEVGTTSTYRLVAPFAPTGSNASNSYYAYFRWTATAGSPSGRTARSFEWTAPLEAGSVRLTCVYRLVPIGEQDFSATTYTERADVTVQSTLVYYDGHLKRNDVWESVDWRLKVMGTWRPVVVRRKVADSWVITRHT